MKKSTFNPQIMNIDILNDIHPLTVDSLVSDAQIMLNEYMFSHVAVVNGTQLLGCIAEYDIKSLDGSKKISECADFYENFFVNEGVNSLEIMEALSLIHI